MRYSSPILFNNGTISITLEPGPTEIMWVLAIRGPSTERPGGSAVRRIIVDQQEICGWLKSIWDAPDPPDYKAMWEAADKVVAEQAKKVEGLGKELSEAYRRMSLDEQLRIQKNNEIEGYKAQVVSLTGQLQKALADLEAEKKAKKGGLSWLFRR